MVKNDKALKDIWWLDSSKIMFCYLFLVLYAFHMPKVRYNEMYDVGYKAIDLFYVFLYFINAVCFFIGFKKSKSAPYVSIEKCNVLSSLCRTLFYLTIIAYIIWFVNFSLLYGANSLLTFLRPMELVAMSSQFHYNAGHISGLTTMTQFGVVVCPMSVFLYKLTQKILYKKMILILFFLAVIRALLFSERLAIMELVIPIFCTISATIKYKTYYNFVPLFALFFLLGFFAVFEYFRSWLIFYQNVYDGSYFSFVVDRLFGYYSLAINTECTAIEFNTSSFFPTSILEWAWKIPVIKEIPSLFLVQRNSVDLFDGYLNEEFNNPGGILVGIKDFGYLGLFFTCFLGYISGKFYKAFRQGSLIGYLLYPIFFLCIADLPRYFYLGNPRSFYVIIGMFLIYRKLSKYSIR